MQCRDLQALLISLGITGLLLGGMAYFISTWWGRLPVAVSLILFILLAVMVIGYPIYALAQWSDRALVHRRETQREDRRTPPE